MFGFMLLVYILICMEFAEGLLKKTSREINAVLWPESYWWLGTYEMLITLDMSCHSVFSITLSFQMEKQAQRG